jgi:hypothetical protein
VATDKTPMEQRRIIHAAIAEAYDGSVVGGWVLVMETMTPTHDDTDYLLSVSSGDATGESDLRPWTAQGWCAIVGADSSHFEYDEDDS